ncbi:hypothetical protein [Tateyamaria omphalii]|uniref:hypothetical protein n=1 Tax=Tateyamaria omphalii TaxID=299262 RepID=UPI001675AEA7|nr:hypothetical protein [Tateyamaria omphalii]
MTLIALGGAGIAGERLRVAWQSMQDGPIDTQLLVKEVSSEPNQSALQQPEKAPFRWTPLFGELQPPTVAVAPTVVEQVAAPEPPKPPLPPLDSLGFSLKGVVRSGDAVWGMVSHPSGDRILKVGEELAAGIRIDRIDAAGLWVDRGESNPELLGFPEQ